MIKADPPLYSPWRLAVAPMLDWTDRHCRYFHRLLSHRALLYTPMVTTGALLHGDVSRHLDFSVNEHPVALQLGGHQPADLASCAKLAQRWGYDEVNLNCGCPSERVQQGAFGACLMNVPGLVADGVKAMMDVLNVPVTVKHRIGINQSEDHGFVRDFVGQVAEAGCRVFIVHARNAWLQGLSPKDNRDVPPLRYECVYQLKREFPDLTFVLNGGVTSLTQIQEQLQHVDGVMLGRHAYQQPWELASWDEIFFNQGPSTLSRPELEAQMVVYMGQVVAQGEPWSRVARHMLGLWNGTPGARRWRQVWSDQRLKTVCPSKVAQQATLARLGG